jgi:hypothetical protein
VRRRALIVEVAAGTNLLDMILLCNTRYVKRLCGVPHSLYCSKWHRFA